MTENFCIYLRNGTEFWMNEEDANKVTEMLMNPNCPQFIRIHGKPVNKFEIITVYTRQEVEDLKHRKRGDWQCDKLIWHVKDEPCDCWAYESKL